MEASSEGEGGKNMNQSSSEGLKKPKRQMKTPFQLEMLEKTYANETYPSESIRAELAVMLDLTDRQLQMWFCHRRLKDKKEAAGVTAMKPHVPNLVGRKDLVDPPRDEMIATEPCNENASGSVSGSESGSGSESSQFDNEGSVPVVPTRYYESPRASMERRVVECIKAQLGEPLREDGPNLGVEFDVLPPGAFGGPIAEHQDRYRHSYDNQLYGNFDKKQSRAAINVLQEPADVKIRSDAYGQVSTAYLYDSNVVGPSGKVLPHVQGNGLIPRQYGVEGQQPSVKIVSQAGRQGHLSSPALSDALNTNTEDIAMERNNIDHLIHVERKRKNDEIRIEREVQANEKRIRKELEKQDLLSKKREEQLRKEMERQERERRKEEQRMMREQQRKEEKMQREEKREMERREKFMQKELLRAERNRQKEELRREREVEKQKLAMERAAARRIAKESMELIEDERLELMELAASNKGLPSIVSLDYDSLQSLDVFRGSLCEFPPKSVKMKKPFAVQPWANSEDNVGKLLLVWRFCLTFADILGLWPFTLDELIEAFHDYDSRLLGEIHIGLMKMIVKDIEDVARTPVGGPGTNQYSAVNLEGGHPQIVEGAYLWGFDIRSWQKHLNPLTWPEILRQFALSAGFGPQLKKKSTERVGINDNDETKVSVDVVSTLRNGSAVENAVAIMQEKGVSLQRKSRHRLTPGTVKFAAYHVLALEGCKGLNVLDLADKIQRSGLRDLRSSKTPEASISVALSRDPILFERIAPSTYCVRPAYRKDPADAETVISEAKEKIQKYLNGFLAGQNAEEEERDDDSESDAEGPEIDDLGTPSDMNKNAERNYVGNGTEEQTDTIIGQDEFVLNGSGASSTDKGTEIDESRSGEPWVQGLSEGEYSDLSVEERLNALVALVGIANEGNSVRVILEDRLDAANALKKQMWAEAQLDKRRMKEEFSFKINDSGYGAATEGSPSPLVLANTLNCERTMEGHGTEGLVVSTENVRNVVDAFPAEKSILAHDTIGQMPNVNQQNGYTAERSRMQMKAFFGHMAEEMYAYKSLPLGLDRRRNRYWIFIASPSSNDPGSGRIFVESPDGLWKLIDSEEAFDALSTSLDTRGVRESHLHIMLQKIEASFRERVRLSSSGAVTSHQCWRKAGDAVAIAIPKDSIESPNGVVCAENSDKLESSSFKIEHERNERERENILKRYQDFQVWMWKESLNASVLRAMACGKKRCSMLLDMCNQCLELFVNETGHCATCFRSNKEKSKESLEHGTYVEEKLNVEQTKTGISSSTQPLRMRMIKVLLSSIEASVPLDAFQSTWTEDFRKTWALKLLNSSCTEDILQALTLLEGAIKRDKLSLDFETTEELLSYCASSRNAFYDSTRLNSVAHLPWIPQTTAAVILRLLELDASVFYSPLEKPEPYEEKKVENFINLSFKYPSDAAKTEHTELRSEKQPKEESWDYTNNYTPSSSKKKKRVISEKGSGRPRIKLPKGVAASVSESGRHTVKHGEESGRHTVKHGETFKQALMQPGERTYMNKHGRGPRTVRKRKQMVEDTATDRFGDMATTRVVTGLARKNNEEKVISANIRGSDDDNSNSMDDAGYSDDDNNAPEATMQEYERWDRGFSFAPRTANNRMIEEMSEGDEGDVAPRSTNNRMIEEMSDDHEGDVALRSTNNRMMEEMSDDEGDVAPHTTNNRMMEMSDDERDVAPCTTNTGLMEMSDEEVDDSDDDNDACNGENLVEFRRTNDDDSDRNAEANSDANSDESSESSASGEYSD